MAINVLEECGFALVQCVCGEGLSVKSGETTVCPNCDRVYQLSLLVTQEIGNDVLAQDDNYREGAAARQAGRNIAACPYELDTLKRYNWMFGWVQKNETLRA